MANTSADPDQLASEKTADLDLHCLQRQYISGFSRGQGLLYFCILHIVILCIVLTLRIGTP